MKDNQGLQLETERLLLRTPQLSDAPDIQKYAGAYEVAKTTFNIPHPYEDGMAEEWIERVHQNLAEGEQFRFVMIRQSDNTLIGGCGFSVNEAHEKAEIGYWVAVPYWDNGYATEAAKRLIAYCFDELNLNRVAAQYYTSNPASRRVMEKAGMTYEGTQRQAIIKEIPALNHRVYHDLGTCAILREDWQSSKA